MIVIFVSDENVVDVVETAINGVVLFSCDDVVSLDIFDEVDDEEGLGGVGGVRGVGGREADTCETVEGEAFEIWIAGCRLFC